MNNPKRVILPRTVTWKRSLFLAPKWFAFSTVAVISATARGAPAELIRLFSFGNADDVHLMESRDGTFYGTTSGNGATSVGSFFRLDLTGQATVLHSFGSNQSNPNSAPVIQGRDGNFYGIAGASIFRLSPGGDYTILHAFNDTEDFTADRGAFPKAGLVQVGNGDFYGTTNTGGKDGAGTIFSMTTDGEITIVHTFNVTDGASPNGTLVLGHDGNLFGATGSDGNRNAGTIFKITPEGAFTSLHIFLVSDRDEPQPTLTVGRDGNFYGATEKNNNGPMPLEETGKFFRITPAGAFTFLYTFPYGPITPPKSAFVQGLDGNFYGITSSALIRISPSGEFTVLHDFHLDGPPSTNLVLGGDGFIYGTYGSGNSETLFKITSRPNDPVTGDESTQSGNDPGTIGNGTGGSVTNGILTYKDSRSGAMVSLPVKRPPFVTEQMARSLPNSSGPWIWISPQGYHANFINVSPDGTVVTTALPMGGTRGMPPPLKSQ